MVDNIDISCHNCHMWGDLWENEKWLMISKCCLTFTVWKHFSIYHYPLIGNLNLTTNSSFSSPSSPKTRRWKRWIRLTVLSSVARTRTSALCGLYVLIWTIIFSHQPGICLEATPYAILQPQNDDDLIHPVRRSGAWAQQKQVNEEAAGVRRRPSRTPYRRYRYLRHDQYWLLELPTTRFITDCDWWSEINVKVIVNIIKYLITIIMYFLSL